MTNESRDYSSPDQLTEWLEGAADIAVRAGALILELYRDQDFETFEKEDDSPVTSADFAANRVILDALADLTPDIPVLSEEGSHLSFEERRKWPRYWIIDPIDGTQEFIRQSGDFGVVISLVEHNRPVLGIIYWPTEDVLFTAQQGKGAYKQDRQGKRKVEVRYLDDPQRDPLKVAISRRQPEALVLDRMGSERELELVRVGSCSLKACLIAEGKADCFLRVGPTGEWDTAAAEVIVGEAGGNILSEYFDPLTYNQEPNLGNPNFIIMGDPAVNWREIFTYHRQAE
ncbi:3'(2'),5'-bisphosphate nucleotidase CysQ [Pseudidiomarina salinarum]|uniref:3'(2'),5'-bisphosphate nucleotidase CysQ n=1 Tax=Pseudidiomarina salinarum TaxID=435908 RepID=UPI00068EF901|nr:3'(2'),5'-bisphosphate nucleotidase CysQ [Pseudidiomarina salinarum]RUO71148.1 3'(2'),5'-bisphosphate nucleotidase [Pseudidiomarina salinarum]